jgi:hypothetical protein
MRVETAKSDTIAGKFLSVRQLSDSCDPLPAISTARALAATCPVIMSFGPAKARS